VKALVEELPSEKRISMPGSNYIPLRLTCWCLALLLGAAQAWATRFTMNPDGISYLDIGDAYWRGDWHNAINACWSPLYSWILCFFLKVLNPSIYWEYPLVHLVNFLIYVAVLASFEFFLRTFIEDRKRQDQELAKGGQTGLSEPSWWFLGYALFVATSLLLISVGQMTPDMLVAGFVYIASALTLRIRADGGTRAFVVLGIVLGLAYLDKTVMFPLGFVFLATAFLAGGISRRSLRNTGIATLIFLGTAGPFIMAISYQKKQFTFGDAGAWVYALYVNHIDYLASDLPTLKHPVRRLSVSPPIYEFGEPLAGTFPLLYDPTYWHQGIKPRFTLISEREPITKAAQEYGHEFFVLFLNVTVGFCILFFTSDSLRQSLAHASGSWVITVPALATLGLYSLVHAESRFVGAPVTLLFLAAYSGVAVPLRRSRRWAAAYTVGLVAFSLFILVAFGALVDYRKMSGPVYAEAASALQQEGVKNGARIGLIWNEQWNGGAARGAFVPRLLKAKVVVEETSADNFWKLDDATRSAAIEQMKSAGAQAILTYRIPSQMQAGWKDLGGTGYFAYIFPATGAGAPR
jgi:hypothetical protein